MKQLVRELPNSEYVLIQGLTGVNQKIVGILFPSKDKVFLTKDSNGNTMAIYASDNENEPVENFRKPTVCAYINYVLEEHPESKIFLFDSFKELCAWITE